MSLAAYYQELVLAKGITEMQPVKDGIITQRHIEKITNNDTSISKTALQKLSLYFGVSIGDWMKAMATSNQVETVEDPFPVDQEKEPQPAEKPIREKKRAPRLNGKGTSLPPEPDPEGDVVNHPKHYTSGEVECIDAIRSSMTPAEFKGFLKGNIQKYIWRYGQKNGVEDLEKARWYLDRLIGVENG